MNKIAFEDHSLQICTRRLGKFFSHRRQNQEASDVTRPLIKSGAQNPISAKSLTQPHNVEDLTLDESKPVGLAIPLHEPHKSVPFSRALQDQCRLY